MNFYKLSLTFILVALIGFSNNEPIKIGFLADGLEEAKLAFRFAIKRVQEEKILEKRIVGDVRKLRFGDIYGAYEATCTAIKNGALAMISSSSSESASHVRSICDTKEIPLIETRIDSPTTNSINLHPTADDLARAYLDLINAWNWQGFTIIYEDAPWLPVIDVIMRNYTDKFNVAVRQLDVTGNGNYRPRLLQVKKSGDKNIVICSSIEKLEEILKQAQQVGLLSSSHHVLITNLDMHTLELEPYQYGGTNITGLRLINPNDEFVKEIEEFFERKFTEHSDVDKNNEDEETDLTELPEGLQADKMRLQTALAFDAVILFVNALKAVARNHIEILRQTPVDCSDPNSIFKSGTTFINFMRTVDPFKGITGDIQFGEFGNRSNFNLDVLELVSDGLKKVGVWNSFTGLETYHDRTPHTPGPYDVFRGKTLKILTVDNEPYGMRKLVSEALFGNDQYEGYGIELIQKLASKIGFNYTFDLQEDKKYGNRQADGSWDGMIGELMADRADLAITDLTITSEREEAVDFTMPFMDLGIQLLYEKPKKANPELLSFMEPLSKNVWALVGGAILLVSISFFIMGRMTPKEWDNPYPCVQEPTELQNQFTFKNSMWFTIGAILQEGSDIAPKAPSTRIVASIWWFFTLIMVSSYTANLASFLTVQKSFSLVEDVEDLLKRQDEGYNVKYGAKDGGSTLAFFKEADSVSIPTPTSLMYQRMYKYMKENQDVMTDSNPAGVEKAKQGDYGFFMESSTIEYLAQRQCEVWAVGEKLDQKGYGIAMKKGSLFRGPLDEAILQMQESGELTRLKQKWWREKRGGGACDSGEPQSAPKLTFNHVKGIFLVLFSGCTIGTTLGIFRWLITIKKISVFLETPFSEVFKEEAKFVFQFSKNVKPNYLARKNSSQYEASMRSMRGSNASESRSRSSVNSTINEPHVAAPAVVRKTARKDNREDV